MVHVKLLMSLACFLDQFKLTVQKMGVVSHLCLALSQLTRISAEKVKTMTTCCIFQLTASESVI